MELFYPLVEQCGIILFLNVLNLENKNIVNGKTVSPIIKNKFENRIKAYKHNLFLYIKNTSLVSISAQIILFPIIAYNYKTISLTFVITNILTSYIIGIIIIFGFLLIIISFPFYGLASFLGKIYKILIDVLLFITGFTAKIPLSKTYIKVPYIWEIIIYYILVISIYYLHRKYRKKWSASEDKTNIIYLKNKLQ